MCVVFFCSLNVLVVERVLDSGSDALHPNCFYGFWVEFLVQVILDGFFLIFDVSIVRVNILIVCVRIDTSSFEGIGFRDIAIIGLMVVGVKVSSSSPSEFGTVALRLARFDGPFGYISSGS
jgi:hypothetical protein